jgi:anti-sigma factor RsiW
MARDDWPERLEAYLDGELDAGAAAAFTAETAADPDLRAALAGRRAFRDLARGALADGLPAAPAERAGTRRRRGRRWPVLAIAATLALAIVVPALLRNEHGAEGPRSTITRAGQVAAVRFGERPGETVTLEAGWHDQSPNPAH